MVYGVWWVFDTDTFPHSSLLTPWLDFVMVGICWVTIMIMTKVNIGAKHSKSMMASICRVPPKQVGTVSIAGKYDET